jgi:hypothetical protein
VNVATATKSPAKTWGFLLDGKWVGKGEAVEVRSPADGNVVGAGCLASASDAEVAVQAAVRTFETTKKMPAYERQRILRGIMEGIRQRHDEFSRMLALEAGKPIKSARAEVDRAIFIFAVAAEEATRIGGEWLPLDWQPATARRAAIVPRFPLGPIFAITPFNFPVNLMAHKLAPAIAAGCTAVLKPAPQAPLSSLLLAEDAGAELGVSRGEVISGSGIVVLREGQRSQDGNEKQQCNDRQGNLRRDWPPIARNHFPSYENNNESQALMQETETREDVRQGEVEGAKAKNGESIRGVNDERVPGDGQDCRDGICGEDDVHCLDGDESEEERRGMPSVLAFDKKLLALIVGEHGNKEPGDANEPILLWMDGAFTREHHSNSSEDQKTTKNVLQGVSKLQQFDTREDEYGPQHQGANDAVVEDFVMRARGHTEGAENEDE